MAQTTQFRIAVLVVCGLAALGALTKLHQPRAEASVADRQRELTFAADVAPGDRQWILAAVAKARPEAARLIDEVDGLVRVTTFSEPDGRVLGWTQTVVPKRYEIRFNVARLDGERQIDRDMVVLHELGHVIDFALLPDGPRNRLASAVPGTEIHAQEKFADTFAKWALRGAVSIVGAGYSVPAPTSLEDWGAPLSALAVRLEVDGR